MKFLSCLAFIYVFSFLNFNIFSQNVIWIIGDSTVSSFNDDYYYPRYGWGTQMQNFIDINKYEVKNIALSGRSSKSYILSNNIFSLFTTKSYIFALIKYFFTSK